MIHIPPEVQTAAGIPAAQALQCGFSCFCYAVRREHFTQTKLVRGQLFVAEHAIGMTEDRAVFRAERTEKLLQFLRADLPVNSLFRREAVLVEQQPRKRIIVRIVTRKRRDRKRFRLAADQLRSTAAPRFASK